MGYFTDNGGFYDAGYWPTFKDANVVFETLIESFVQQSIPVKYIQLDDWWYVGGGKNDSMHGLCHLHSIFYSKEPDQQQPDQRQQWWERSRASTISSRFEAVGFAVWCRPHAVHGQLLPRKRILISCSSG
jgi:hypothetical protein